ncbi:MAG: hypothetical protein JJE22_09325, partial [Bacteroidia bacterium]|nr:hypothetical protein [Bacteroidia bacterium]
MKVFLLFLAVISITYGCNSGKEPASSKEETPAVKSDSSSTNKDILPAVIQIKSALLAAPLEKRDSCTVYGYSSDTELIVLRKGTNELICLADDPRQPDFSV